MVHTRRKMPSMALLGITVFGILAVAWLVNMAMLGRSMRKSTLAEINITNHSGQQVYVTLQGLGADGEVAVLPQVDSIEHPGRYARPKETVMDTGATRTVIYSWDDINFAWIAVRGNTGHWKVLRTGLPTTIRYPNGSLSFFPPDEREYSIPPLKDLPNAPDSVISVATTRRTPVHPVN